MTWREWVYYSEGLKTSSLRQWEHTRAINWMLYRINADPKHQQKNITTWWPLPTDVKQAFKVRSKRLTKQELAAFLERMR